MKLKELDIYAQDLAVIKHVNEALGTTLELEQLRARDFTRLRLFNCQTTIFIADLKIMDKVCVGLLAVVQEIEKESNT